MSNDTTGNPYVLDTAADIEGRIEVSRLEFVPSATNDDLEVQDAAGNVIWKIRAIAAAGNYEAYGMEYIDFIPPKAIRGLHLTTIDGGVLRVYKTDRSP